MRRGGLDEKVEKPRSVPRGLFQLVLMVGLLNPFSSLQAICPTFDQPK